MRDFDIIYMISKSSIIFSPWFSNDVFKKDVNIDLLYLGLIQLKRSQIKDLIHRILTMSIIFRWWRSVDVDIYSSEIQIYDLFLEIRRITHLYPKD